MLGLQELPSGAGPDARTSHILGKHSTIYQLANLVHSSSSVKNNRSNSVQQVQHKYLAPTRVGRGGIYKVSHLLYVQHFVLHLLQGALRLSLTQPGLDQLLLQLQDEIFIVGGAAFMLKVIDIDLCLGKQKHGNIHIQEHNKSYHVGIMGN